MICLLCDNCSYDLTDPCKLICDSNFSFCLITISDCLMRGWEMGVGKRQEDNKHIVSLLSLQMVLWTLIKCSRENKMLTQYQNSSTHIGGKMKKKQATFTNIPCESRQWPTGYIEKKGTTKLRRGRVTKLKLKLNTGLKMWSKWFFIVNIGIKFHWFNNSTKVAFRMNWVVCPRCRQDAAPASSFPMQGWKIVLLPCHSLNEVRGGKSLKRRMKRKTKAAKSQSRPWEFFLGPRPLYCDFFYPWGGGGHKLRGCNTRRKKVPPCPGSTPAFSLSPHSPHPWGMWKHWASQPTS